MMRFALVILVIIPVFYLLDLLFFRGGQAERDVITIRASDAEVVTVDVDSTVILNKKGRDKFVKDAMNTIFNFHTANAQAHIESEDIKQLFINAETYESFKSNFENWAYSELKGNHISIKSSVNIDAKQTTTIGLGAVERAWIVMGEQLFYNRGVGGSEPETLYFEMMLYFRPDRDGLGIYSLSLRNSF